MLIYRAYSRDGPITATDALAAGTFNLFICPANPCPTVTTIPPPTAATCPDDMPVGTPPNCMVRENTPAPSGSGMAAVAQRCDSNDDFEKVGYAAAAAVIGSVVWNFYKIKNPGLTNRINFTAKPTSNRSLQYNLSADINKNWHMNFTVDKNIKINSETNNSNLYKLKFEYRF